MIRLLVVLLIVGGATWYLWGGNRKEGSPPPPEARYEQETARAKQLEKELQEQAVKQLQDADTRQQ
jgi:hypothetical protein